MALSNEQMIFTIVAVALGAMTTRFLPFLLFPENKKPPAAVAFLGRVLPPAVMGLLVIYCLKDVSLITAPYGLSQGLAILSIVILHVWKRNVLLSICGGTIVYMLLVRLIF